MIGVELLDVIIARQEPRLSQAVTLVAVELYGDGVIIRAGRAAVTPGRHPAVALADDAGTGYAVGHVGTANADIEAQFVPPMPSSASSLKVTIDGESMVLSVGPRGGLLSPGPWAERPAMHAQRQLLRAYRLPAALRRIDYALLTAEEHSDGLAVRWGRTAAAHELWVRGRAPNRPDITITDDLGTRYAVSSAGSAGRHGTTWFTPAVPYPASALKVTHAGQTAVLALTPAARSSVGGAG